MKTSTDSTFPSSPKTIYNHFVTGHNNKPRDYGHNLKILCKIKIQYKSNRFYNF